MFCVELRIVLLSRFQPEAMNLPPGERGGMGGGGPGRKKGVVFVAVVEMSPDSW